MEYVNKDDLCENLAQLQESLTTKNFPLLPRDVLIERERGIEMARQYILNIQQTIVIDNNKEINK